MRKSDLLDLPPPEILYVLLDPSASLGKRNAFEKQILSILPFLSWRAHVYIIHDNPSGQIERASELVVTLTDYLKDQDLSTIYVHPFISMGNLNEGKFNAFEELLSLTQPFQQEAYDRQSEMRLLIFPIVELEKGVSAKDILAAADFFQMRLAKPSFYLHEESCLDPDIAGKKGLRIYVDPSGETSARGIISRFWINHIFEDILERIESGYGYKDILSSCRRHLVVSERENSCFACFAKWKEASPLESIVELEKLPGEVDCVGCITGSCLSMKADIEANGRRREGWQVFSALGMALSEQGAHREAISHARMAFEFSDSDADRAAALLHQGLCHLSLMELNEAQMVLEAGVDYSSDVAPFLYQQGNVQFARRNYPAAAECFRRALAKGSDEVSEADLLFNLGVSYVNMEEFEQAHSCLARIEQVSAPVRFYQGICDLGLGMVEPALNRFRDALAAGPAPEDISRVLFYIGTCLKEMGDYEGAIVELEKAVRADPSDYVNYNLLGFCFYQVKEYEKAIAALSKAIEINPGSAIDYASIGSNLRELGRLEDAIAMYNMALSLDPSLTFARENIERLRRALEKG